MLYTISCFEFYENLFHEKLHFLKFKYWMNKEKLARARFEPATSGLTFRRSTN